MIIYRACILLAFINFLSGCQPATKNQSATSIETLTLSSDLVIVGKVLQNHSRWENGHIVTTSDIQPLQTLKGKAGGAVIQVSFLGGVVDNINEHVEHEAALQQGQISVLFLKQSKPKPDIEPPALNIVSEHGNITLVHPWERESRLANNRRLVRQLEDISIRVQKAGGVK